MKNSEALPPSTPSRSTHLLSLILPLRALVVTPISIVIVERIVNDQSTAVRCTVKQGVAIAIPYSEGQTEPSKPLRQLVTLTGDDVVDTAMLQQLFRREVYDGECEVEISTPDDGFGDIVVSIDVGCHLFLTYVS